MVATEKYCLKTLDFFCVDFLMYKGSHMLVMADISELWCILGHPSVESGILVSLWQQLPACPM